MMTVKTLHLKTLSPVFIGSSEESVMAAEYVKKGNEYFRLHEDFFYSITGNMDIKALKRPKNINELGPFKGYYKEKSRYRLHNCPRIHGEVKTFIRTGMDLPYLPGSSLKGALRSAYMISSITDTHQLERQLQKVINSKKPLRRNSFSKLSESLDRNTYKGRLNDGKYHPNPPQADLFRLIKVSDSKPLGKDELQMTPIIVYTIHGNTLDPKIAFKSFPMQINVEAIPANTKLTVRITWDDFLEKQFQSSINFEEILKGSISFYKKIAAEEREFFNQYHKSRIRDFYHKIREKEILQVGFGSGLMGNTVTSIVSDEMKCKIRNAIRNHPANIAPKSRRLVCSNDGTPVEPLGWMEVVSIE